MDPIKLTAGGTALLFGDDGNVSNAATKKAVGTWTSQSTQKDNKVRYTVNGADQTPLTAAFAFNANNQLTMSLTAPDGTVSSVLTLVGQIVIDNDHNLTYQITDQNGNATGRGLPVYGSISFEQAQNDLVLALTGGGSTKIAGLNGTQSLQAIQNNLADFKGDDLLVFSAQTTNIIDGQADPLILPAQISFAGGWDILPSGSVIFNSNIQSSNTGQTVALEFAGKLKGVTAGFAYFAGPTGTDFAFNIAGQHVFKSVNAETDLSWESTIGFSKKTFRAQVKVNEVTKFKDGQLSFNGTLDLQVPPPQSNGQQGGTPTLSLQMDATYTFDNNNMLVFKADVTGGSQPSYDLMLQGTFKYSNLALTFSIDYTNKSGATDLSVQVGIQGNKNSMIQQLAIVLNITPDQAAVKLNLSFSVRMEFADGVRVKKAAEAA